MPMLDEKGYKRKEPPCIWTHHATDDPNRYTDLVMWHSISCRECFITKFDPKQILFCPYCGHSIEKSTVKLEVNKLEVKEFDCG